MTSFRITFIFILMLVLIGSLTFGGQNASGKVAIDFYRDIPSNTTNSGKDTLMSIGPNTDIYVKAYIKDVSNIVLYQVYLLIDTTKLSWVELVSGITAVGNNENSGEKNILKKANAFLSYTFAVDPLPGTSEGVYKIISFGGIFSSTSGVTNANAPDGEGLVGLFKIKTKSTFTTSDRANILVKRVLLGDNSTPRVEEDARAMNYVAGTINSSPTEVKTNTAVVNNVTTDTAKVTNNFVDGSKVSTQFTTGTGISGRTVTITSIGARLTDTLATDANKKVIESKTAAFYNIETNVTTTFTATLVVTFTTDNLTAAGLAAANATRLVLAYFRTSDNKWVRAPSTIINTVTMTATATGLDHFSIWALVDSTSADVVPIELSTFSARLDNKDGVILEWTTVSETNNYGFYIERSKDNVNFVEIGFVKGNGNSAKELAYSYIDKDALEVGTYYYRLRQVDFDGSFAYSKPASVGVKAPDKYSLFSAYPNPFNPMTNIEFSLKEKGNVKLIVYNTLGQVVQTIVDNKEMNAGKHRVVFNAKNLASGMYIYKIQVNGFTDAKKVVYLK